MQRHIMQHWNSTTLNSALLNRATWNAQHENSATLNSRSAILK